MVDITMNIDETLELDYLIQRRDPEPVTVNADSDEYELDGFETRTSVFKPNKTGTYEIKLNDQTYEVKVINIPDSGVSLYDMENVGDTTTVIDSWDGNDLTANGPSYTTNAKVGSHSRLYDGTDDTDDASNANITSGALSILGWVIDHSGSNRHYFTGIRSNIDGKGGFLGTDGNGEFYFRGLGSGGDILDSTTTDIRDGTYHFFGVAVDPISDEVRTNIDGANDYTFSGSVTSADLTDTILRLGNKANVSSSRHHDGILDYIQFRDKALTQSEFQSVYNETK